MAQSPERYPVEKAKAAVSFVTDVRARFVSNPSVHTEFYNHLTGFGKGEITNFRAVVARAEALLHGQPDLIARFNAFFPSKPKIKLPQEDITAAKRRGQKVDHSCCTAVAAGRAKARSELYDQAGKRDGAFNKALQFLQLVKQRDAELYNRVLAELSYVETDRRMDAHEIYARAEGIFGPTHSDLLHDFAEFLPAEHNPSPSSAEGAPEEHCRTSKRKPTPSVVAADADKPTRAKKPRADDCKKRHALIDCSEAEYCGATAQDDDVVVAFRKVWVFETEYSKLVATIRQAERLQKERTQGDSSSSSHGRRTFEDLFPSRECREFLEFMYKHMWKEMQDALEDDNRTDQALATIMASLMRKENEFVKEAMARRDVTRVYDRVKKLVMDRVRAGRENQRH